MKKRVFGLAVVASLAVMSAWAADLPSRRGPPPAYIPPPPPPVLTWTGMYVGLNLGGGWLDQYSHGHWLAPLSIAPNTGGVVGGAQVGYNFQFTPLFVAGLETDFQGSSVGSADQPFGASRSVGWFGTLRGRAGASLLNSQLLLYGTGGFAYGDLRLNYGWLGSQARTGTGWTAGGGVEYAFLPNWSAKVEYLYANIGADYGPTFAAPFVIETEQRAHLNTVRAGVNYRFNWMFAPGPAAAAY